MTISALYDETALDVLLDESGAALVDEAATLPFLYDAAGLAVLDEAGDPILDESPAVPSLGDASFDPHTLVFSVYAGATLGWLSTYPLGKV